MTINLGTNNYLIVTRDPNKALSSIMLEEKSKDWTVGYTTIIKGSYLIYYERKKYI